MKRVDTKHDIGGKTKHAERVLSEDKYDIIQIHMKKGEVITSHHAKEETLIIVRTGKVYFIVEKETMTLTNEQILQMDPYEKHSLEALEESNLILLKIK